MPLTDREQRRQRMDPYQADNLKDLMPFPSFLPDDPVPNLIGSNSPGGGIPLFGGGSDPLTTLPGTDVTAAAQTIPGAPTSSPSILSKLFGKGGLDPTTLVLGGLSLLGGQQDPFQKKVSFSGTGASDPVTALKHALGMITDVQPQLLDRVQHPQQSTAQVPGAPRPVQVPGMQVGGAFGMDPALRSAAAQAQAQQPEPMPSDGTLQRRKPQESA